MPSTVATGSYYLLAKADSAGTVAESNENNNRAQRVVTIRGNKVTNGSFEQSSGSAPTSWTGSQGTAYSSNPANASDGTHSVSATGNGGPAAINNPTWTSAPINVAPGQTLCILEAMKLMNEVKAEVEGIVRAIHAQNADAVEYGQLLFELEPVNGRPLDAV